MIILKSVEIPSPSSSNFFYFGNATERQRKFDDWQHGTRNVDWNRWRSSISPDVAVFYVLELGTKEARKRKKTKASLVSMYRITPSYLYTLKALILADLALFFLLPKTGKSTKERRRERRSIARPTARRIVLEGCHRTQW